jgi:hypothetical protein
MAQRAEASVYLVVIRGGLVMQALRRVRGKVPVLVDRSALPSRRHDNAETYPLINVYCKTSAVRPRALQFSAVAFSFAAWASI